MNPPFGFYYNVIVQGFSRKNRQLDVFRRGLASRRNEDVTSYNVIVQGFPLKNVCHYHAIFQFVVQWGEQSINGNLLSCPRAQRLGNSSYAKTSQETSLKGEGDLLTLTACRDDYGGRLFPFGY